MNATVRRLAALLAVSIAVAVAGCSRPAAPVAPTSTESTQATAPAESTAAVIGTATATPVAVSGGPITHPPAGSKERTALLDAARSALGISSPFTVIQLYVQGDVAIADLVPYGGTASQRRFLGFRRVGGAWTTVWHWQHERVPSKLKAAMPFASAELLAKLAWDLPMPVGTASLKASAEAAALKVAKSAAGPTIGTLRVVKAETKIAQDHKGTWWASVVVASDKPGIDALSVYLKRSGSGTWTSVDYGTGIDTTTDSRFPAEVRGKL